MKSERSGILPVIATTLALSAGVGVPLGLAFNSAENVYTAEGNLDNPSCKSGHLKAHYSFSVPAPSKSIHGFTLEDTADEKFKNVGKGILHYNSNSFIGRDLTRIPDTTDFPGSSVNEFPTGTFQWKGKDSSNKKFDFRVKAGQVNTDQSLPVTIDIVCLSPRQ